MLSFLGNGSAFNPFRNDTGAYMCRGGTLYMIDCGSSVFKAALARRIFDDIKNVFIIITHLHMDHCGSLSQLIMYLLYKRGVKPVIVFPDVDLRELLRITGVTEDMYDHVMCTETSLPCGMKVRFMRSSHVDKIHCYSLEIESHDGEMIYYSGDSGVIPPDILERYLSGGYSAFYQDTCGEIIPGRPHMNIEELCRLIPGDKRSKMYCIHLDPLLTDDMIIEKGFNSVNV